MVNESERQEADHFAAKPIDVEKLNNPPEKISAGGATDFFVNDDVFHLPSREVKDSSIQPSWEVNEMRHGLNSQWQENALARTPTAKVSYSLNQELNIIKDWADKNRGPPGFYRKADLPT